MKSFAVIGAGNWGQLHARVYEEHPFARLAVVCDENMDRARACAEAHGARAEADWKAVAADAGIDAVSVATPDFAHTEIVLGLIDAGKDVLVEKPLATTVDQCRKMQKAARDRGVKLMVDFHNRWSPPFWQTREAVRAGDLGDIRLIYMRLNDTIFVPTKMLPWAARSSPLFFLGSHCVDTIRWMLADEAEWVQAVEGREILKGMGIDTPDYVLTTIGFRRGAVATVENCWILPETTPVVFDLQAEIIGSGGSVRIDGSHNRTMEMYTREKAAFPDVMVMPRSQGRQVGFAAESIRHFVDSVVGGTEPCVTAEDGVETARILEAAIQSAKTGTRVQMSTTE